MKYKLNDVCVHVKCAAILFFSLSVGNAFGEVWRAGLKAGVVSGTSLNETAYPEGDALLADAVLGPVATTERTKAAGNASTDPSVVWTKDRTWVYWGEMWFDGKSYRFASWMSDNMLVKLDGEVVLRQTQSGYPTTSGVLLPSKGWHAIEIRVFNGNDAVAGPYKETEAYKGWDATHGFGLATWGASGNSFLGFEYPYPVDDGTGSLFRYDAGEEATSNVTYDHTTVTYANHTLAFAAGEGGSVSSAGGTCAANATLTVTATPASGYRFVRWEGDVAEGLSFTATAAVPGNCDRTLTAVFEQIADLATKTYKGTSGGKWNVDGNWDPSGVPGPTDVVVIPNGKNVELDVFADVGSLTLQGSACLSANFASGKITTRTRTAANQTSTETIGLDVRGDLTMGGTAKIYLGGYRQASATRLAVKGNLTLAGTANELAVYAGPTNGTDLCYQYFRRGGAKVIVGGTTTVGSGCWIYPYSHNDNACGSAADSPKYNTGNPVLFDLRDLDVAAGGGFNADGIGWAKRYCDSPISAHTMNANSAAPNNSGNSGGSYGGRSGTSSSNPENAFRPYGYELAPFYPGMPGGGEGALGGGVIRINAAAVTLNGTLSAKSGTAYHNLGAGGGIWVTCASFAGSGAKLLANSRWISAEFYPTGDYGVPKAGGAGGRIAVGLGLSAYDLDCLYARGATDAYVAGTLDQILGPGKVTADVGASTGYYQSGNYVDGEPGTAFACAAAVAGKVALCDSEVGVVNVTPGTDIKDRTVPATKVSADGSTKLTCAGYEIVSGTTKVTGTGNTVADSFVVSADTVLTWNYQPTHYKAITSALGDAGATVACDWTASGSDMTVTATAADATKEFQYWLGDVPYAQRFRNPLVVSAQAGFSAVAFFGNKKENAAEYTSRNADTIDWFTAGDWTPNGIPGTNDTAKVYSSSTKRCLQAKVYAAVGDLIVDKTYLFVNATRGTDKSEGIVRSGIHDVSLWKHSAVDSHRTEPWGLDVFGDLSVINGGCLHLGGIDLNAPLKVDVRGDVSVSGGSFIVATAGYDLSGDLTPFWTSTVKSDTRYLEIPKLDLLTGAGNVFKVRGKTTLGDNGWMRPMCDYRSGVPVRFEFGEVEVAATGGFDAAEGGYGRNYFIGTKRYYSCPGGFADNDTTQGGSHASRGGAGATSKATNIIPYGFENAPIYTGSSNGSHRDGHRGSGTIRVDAEKFTLNGTLTVKPTMSGQKGGSAGGAVFVNAGAFVPGDACSVCVDGGDGKSGAGGGAGRAAICVGLTEDQLAELATNDTHTAEGATVTQLSDYLMTRFSAEPGKASSTSYSNADGYGTGVYIVNTAGQVTLTVAGNPSNIGTLDPAYGLATYDSGASVTATAPECAFVSADERSRRVNAGWVLTDEGGTTIDSGSTLSATFTLNKNSVLTWQWTTLQHAIAVVATAGGLVVTNGIDDAESVWQDDGSTVSLTATPAEGHVFVGWSGDVPSSQRTNPVLTLTADRGRTFRAHFAPTAAGERVWTGTADGNWANPANWEPEGLPGIREVVTIPAGKTVVVSDSLPVEVGDLVVEAGAALTVRGTLFSTRTTFAAEATEADLYPSVVKVHGNLTVGGRMELGARYSMSEPTLTVNGGLTVLTNGTLSVFAGYKNLDWRTKDGWWQGGGLVTVGGRVTVRNGGWILPWCNGLKGAPVIFRTGSVFIEANAGINAVSKGWDYSEIGATQTVIVYGPGVNSENNYAGADHAAKGGSATSGHTPPGCTYGDPLAPYMPGCTARITSYPADGGGAIRLFSTGQIVCAGSINADGGGTCCSDSGGGSGGGVWLACTRLCLRRAGSVTARGGDTYKDGAGNNGSSGAGGGGRICICEHLTEADLLELFNTGTTTNRRVTIEDFGGSAEVIEGETLVSARGGHPLGTAKGGAGGDGTIRRITGPAPGLLIMVR